MSITTTASRYLGRVVRAASLVAVEVTAPSAPTVDLFAGFDQFGADTDEMEARFTEAATGTPAAAPKPVETVEVAPVGPAKPYSPAEMPSVALVEAAAIAFDLAGEQARSADRTKRKSRKILDRMPAGVFGRAVVTWEESARETPDLVKIAAILAEHGIDEIPMRKVAPSLKVAILPA
ncbi:hypothetical protein I6A60_00390 [Frankia sp. AgB1.9]|uniref:hypothetical protein n=1 Tax=unclassified Frankia TaxID=2632575 RepID=UPI0019336CD2|nr:MULTISPECIES: hypothetical protein [unclassified Frankia]MBL7487338.1 hypothetical protein [Frankia sp. AgW1.1]MBL7546346.1 hypothetical protein [Frankia sp. AgB1.9]MBL7618608.1 hypothetical protein [Frankia sp. AgB1.8]